MASTQGPGAAEPPEGCQSPVSAVSKQVYGVTNTDGEMGKAFPLQGEGIWVHTQEAQNITQKTRRLPTHGLNFLLGTRASMGKTDVAGTTAFEM